MAILILPRYTPDQYLELERASATRHEFVNGQIHAMAGASEAHNIIVLNIGSELRARLRGRGCRAYVSDMRVKVPATELYTYPDITALCEHPRLEDEHLDTLLNPAVIIEVLSPSTEAYDRGAKFGHYRRIDSLREYVLVSQGAMRVERYVRHGEDWLFTEIGGAGEILRIESLACEIPLREIYDGVELSPTDARQPGLFRNS
jgi:Uma2 family endonuclease